MDFDRMNKIDIESRVYEAYEKAKESQERLNAVVTFVDPKDQLEALKEVDEKAPMYGMPVVLKDNVNTKGIRTTASSRILDNYVPVYNAHIVDKLEKAGAIVIAKSSMDELGMGGTNRNAYTGPVHNAWDNTRISGGSSGGSAALVAAGVVPFAIGTDTGDSVRKPAAYNGIIGMKPTYGRISRYGIIPYASSLDHVGYFTTSIKDAAVALEVLAGRDDRDMTSSFEKVEAYSSNLNSDLRGKRIAILDNVQEAIEDEEIRQNFDSLMKKLQARGAVVEHVRMDDQLMNALLPTYYIIANAEATANHSNLDGIRFGMREDGESVEDVMINTRTKGFCSYVRKRFVIGSYSLFVENQDKIFRKAQKVRRLIVNDLKQILDQYDVVIASAAGTIAPLVDESKDSHLGADNNVAENHMVLGNFSGYPSITVPTGFSKGMPIAINMSAKAFDEQTLFNIGLAIEEETGLKGNDVEVDA
ncbi:amidase family protein [Erysipelotrichaceae bacterium HCN-30851]